MNIEYKEFVGIYKDVYASGFTNFLIDFFEEMLESNKGFTRREGEGVSKKIKDDTSYLMNPDDDKIFNNSSSMKIFYQGLQNCFNEYIEEFSTLKDISLSASKLKMQKTVPGGGYHVWHCEQMSSDHSGRALVFLCYLNTIEREHGGETEFLFQKLRINPLENMMLIWPASFTHTHRGNLLMGNKNKYIVTGWFNIV